MAIGSGGTWQRKAVYKKDVMLNHFFVLAATWNTDGYLIGLLRGGVPRGGGSLIFPNVP